ncbi:hypothetical protein [Streptomyces xylophagus]|uniref:hypothetical protein n=1 Tax=Streptomyces xylophagus TaxID=285514 RepID=UPI0005B87477|nr:hypothetical protein [Streptomyces xylophagus]
MDDSRQSDSGAGAVLGRLAPPPALCGFLLLLTLVFAASYAVGSGVGPVAPGMHGTGVTGTSSGSSGSSHTGNTQDIGEMGEMDMHGGGH